MGLFFFLVLSFILCLSYLSKSKWMGPLRKHLIIYTWGFLKQVKPLGNCISQDSLKNRNWWEICIILYINKLIFINKLVLNSIKILITVVSYSKGLGSGSFLVLRPQPKSSYTEEADSLVVAKSLRLVACFPNLKLCEVPREALVLGQWWKSGNAGISQGTRSSNRTADLVSRGDSWA